MSKVAEAKPPKIHNDNLSNLKPYNGGAKSTQTKPAPEADQSLISKNAKAINSESTDKTLPDQKNSTEASKLASEVAENLPKLPVLPIVAPSAKPNAKLLKKLEDKTLERTHYLKKPAVIFIEGFSAFGISNGDGISDMAENYPGAKKFSWNDKDEILSEIKKHTPEQPVVLVGHSFGGDTAVEIANELNSAKNGFRSVDLLVGLDSVGFNNTIMPINVKRNLNFFQEGVLPFLHGAPTIARNTNHTEVVNELRTELHSRIDDTPDVQFQIFETINETLGKSNESEPEIVIQIDLADLIGNQLSSLKTE